MATGPLRFRTPYIEELPTTHTTRQAPGFAWVAVAATPNTATDDPAKNWGTTNRKRARLTGNFGAGSGVAGLGLGGDGVGGIVSAEAAREASSARARAEVDKRFKELNSDAAGRDVAVPVRDTGRGNKVGRTPNTKKILTSGKTFAHYLDDEEAEIALRGRRGWEGEEEKVVSVQRASKTPIARRKPVVVGAAAKEERSVRTEVEMMDAGEEKEKEVSGDVEAEEEGEWAIPPLPTQAEMDALLNAMPLTYKEARSAPPPADAPPPRKFCEICGYWGRVKCMKCGSLVCSVMCKDAHDEHKCLKFYA